MSKVCSSAINKSKDNIRIPLYFVLAFLVVFAVNGLFVYLAVSTNHGVVTENHYEKGLRFNEVVKQVRDMKDADGRSDP